MLLICRTNVRYIFPARCLRLTVVHCRVCRKKVEDCEHCVYPITAPRLPVADAKVKTIAYNVTDRILEIALHSGQVWQLSPVPEGVYKELCDSTIASFLNFIAKRYNAVPVKTGVHAIQVPIEEPCPKCKGVMVQVHRTQSAIDPFVRIRWSCGACNELSGRRTAHHTFASAKHVGIKCRENRDKTNWNSRDFYRRATMPKLTR